MEEEKTRELKAVLRHGCAACRTECRTTAVPDVKPGDAVVARTDRGVEYALILTRAEVAGADDRAPDELDARLWRPSCAFASTTRAACSRRPATVS